MRDVLVTVVNESYEFELAELDLAVALVWGSADTDVPLWVAERAAQLLGDPPPMDFEGRDRNFVPSCHPGVLRAARVKLR